MATGQSRDQCCPACEYESAKLLGNPFHGEEGLHNQVFQLLPTIIRNIYVDAQEPNIVDERHTFWFVTTPWGTAGLY